MVKFGIVLWWKFIKFYGNLNAGGGAVAEPVTGMIDEDLRCFGLCTGNCKEDCASKGFKNGFCVQQGSLNQCCCLWLIYIIPVAIL